MNKEAISRRLSQARDSLSYNQAGMGAIAGVSQRTFSSWENGVLPGQWESLVSLAQESGLSVDYLLGLSNDPRPEQARAVREAGVEYVVNANVGRVVDLFLSLDEDDQAFVLEMIELVNKRNGPRIIGDE